MLQLFSPDNESVPFQSSPFPLNSSIEMDLFKVQPLTEEENQAMTAQYNRTYMHWVGALLYISDKIRWDLS